ncbi:hypothetical protein [Methanobrevibacter sp.]|uniref:hypothetical protein n=1 Tax=Methanobrevibacter sp. TaxID=66852 RepID=UPI00388F8FB5
MSSRSATVLVIFIVACIAFCLATVFASMTGPISILPNESESGGILDNLSVIENADTGDHQSYGYDNSNDYSSNYESSQSSEPQVETTTDESSQSSSSSHSSSSTEQHTDDSGSQQQEPSSSDESHVETYQG